MSFESFPAFSTSEDSIVVSSLTAKLKIPRSCLNVVSLVCEMKSARSNLWFRLSEFQSSIAEAQTAREVYTEKFADLSNIVRKVTALHKW